MSVTIQSAAASILGWTATQLETFNDGSHPWVAYRKTKEGTAPDTPEEVANFLGDTLSENSYGVVSILKEQGLNLGFQRVLIHAFDQ